MRIIEDINLVDTVEDWSRVRSPGRARRRLRYGYRQNIRYVSTPKNVAFQVGGTFYMHPEMARQLREMTREVVPKGRIELPLTGLMRPPLWPLSYIGI